MRCEAARKYLSPYLDSELDQTTSFDISQHLEHCEGCRARFEAEQVLEGQMVSSLERPEPGDDDLWSRALHRRSRRQVLVRATSAAAIVLVFVGAFFWFPARHDLLQDLKEDFEKLASGKQTMDLQSSDPERIREFFRENMGLAIQVPVVSGMDPLGARQCSFRGTPTAFISYRCGGKPVAVAIFDAAHLDRFPKDAPLVEQGSSDFRFDGVQTVAEKRGWKIVCVTGPLPLEDLRRLGRSF